MGNRDKPKNEKMSRIIIHNIENKIENKIENINMAKTITLKTLTNESLADLFLSMSLKEDNRQEAEKAFTIFYNLYKNYLYTVVRKACESWPMYGEELIQTVHENTFLKVYEKAEDFLIIEDIPFDRQEKRMKSWISKIARNEMFKLLRELKEEKDNIEYHENLVLFENPDEEIEAQKSEDFILAEKALNSLSERDRHILVTYLMFEEDNKKLPSSEIKRLAEMWNVLPDNLRQIKKRSLEKVRKYIETYKSK